MIPLLAWAVSFFLAWLACCGVSVAGPVADRVAASSCLRVCIWPQYRGVTYRRPRTGQLSGIDADLSTEFAKDLGAKLRYVDSSWTNLADDLAADRCDVAMFAVGVTRLRQARLRFSQPYLMSGIYGVTSLVNLSIRQWSDIDQPGVRVAVQSGTVAEAAMAGALKQAQLVVVESSQTREEELAAGRVDVFLTNYLYSRSLLDNTDWVRLVSPPQALHVVRHAYAVKPGDEAWLARVNAFVSRIKSDGRLMAAAQRHGLSASLAP